MYYLRLFCGCDIIRHLYVGGYGFRKVKNLSASACISARTITYYVIGIFFQADEEEGYRKFGGCLPVHLPGAICKIKYEGNFKTEVLQPVKEIVYYFIRRIILCAELLDLQALFRLKTL